MFASVLIPTAFFMFLLMRVPQAPMWLAAKGRYDEALQVLSKINGAGEAGKELEEIKNSLAGEQGTLGELFQPGMRKALSVGVVLALMNNWTGWNGIAYYLPSLFQESGYPQASAAIGEFVLIGGEVILTIVSIFLVDRVGRRISLVGHFFCHVFLLGRHRVGFPVSRDGANRGWGLVLVRDTPCYRPWTFAMAYDVGALSHAHSGTGRQHHHHVLVDCRFHWTLCISYHRSDFKKDCGHFRWRVLVLCSCLCLFLLLGPQIPPRNEGPDIGGNWCVLATRP